MTTDKEDTRILLDLLELDTCHGRCEEEVEERTDKLTMYDGWLPLGPINVAPNGLAYQLIARAKVPISKGIHQFRELLQHINEVL